MIPLTTKSVNAASRETKTIQRQAATVCRQAADSRKAKTYRDNSVTITGAGASMIDGVTREIWTGIDCIAWIQYSGQVDAAADEKSITVAGNGKLIAHNEGPDGVREYTVSASSSAMTLNGANVPIDADEHSWIAAMAREFLRRTGRRVDVRAAAALTSDGIDGLIAEAAAVPKTRTRVEYLRDGFSAAGSPDAVVNFVHRGAALLDSLDDRAAFLLGVPQKYATNLQVLKAIYEEASVVEPDGGVEAVLKSYPPPRPLPRELKPLIEKMIAGISSSDRREILSAYYLNVQP
jgi:hypothetical protein